ncbi:cytochrome c oxidase subunit 2 [Paenibacillus castaneae]|uniref:cytochrome C oxidase subunit II n=1 Tax=Paenibacillus castaneae TaxID=474957 RepID=UPI0011AF9F50|nr:cytochrome C oxidase subunit II [Paenibacillus castaneae]NIK76131.1 cytochrome c oxidase subunit 2 [Paenibacillus castaneae]
MKKWLLFASAMCLVIVLAACGSNNTKNKVENTDTAPVTADGGAASSDIVITASNWKFDKKEYKIKAGETANLKLESVEGMHGIKISNTDYTIKSGGTTEVNIAEPGTYEMICSVPCGAGHVKMKTNLIVE